jgi:ligand-binding sensor domain-containing protein
MPETIMSNDVMDIAEAQDGKIWVATDQGVNILNPAQLDATWQSILPRRNQLLFPRVSGLLADARRMWFFYDQESQASLLDGENWLLLDSNKGLTGFVNDAVIDQRGYTWFATTQGIKVWDGSLMRSYTPPFESPGSTYKSLMEQNGIMWVGSDRGLMQYNRFQWKMVLPKIVVNDIAVDSTPGGLLLGTDQGLVRFDGSQSYLWMINLGNDVVLAPKVTAISWDGEKNLWVGTNGDGLFRYDGKKWEKFSTANGLPTDNIRVILKDHQGSLWIATVTGDGGGALVRYVP